MLLLFWELLVLLFPPPFAKSSVNVFPWLEVESFAVLHQTGGAFEGSNSLALEKDLPFPNLAPVQLPSLAQEIEVLWVGNRFAFLLDPPRMYLVQKTPENGRTLASGRLLCSLEGVTHLDCLPGKSHKHTCIAVLLPTWGHAVHSAGIEDVAPPIML